MNTREYINPKLLEGLTTYDSLDEPIVILITKEKIQQLAPVLLDEQESA